MRLAFPPGHSTQSEAAHPNRAPPVGRFRAVRRAIGWSPCASPSSATPACGSRATAASSSSIPGVFTDPAALDGADAVLITHEHADHVHPDHLRGTDAPIWTIAAVERLLREQAPDVAERVTVVRPGDRLEVAGTAVEVVGEKHAVIHPDYDRFDNSGYVLESGGASVYHPGDALTAARPRRRRAAGAGQRTVAEGRRGRRLRARGRRRRRRSAIHDRVYSDIGLDMVAAHMANLLPDGQAFERREPGQDL